MRRLLTILIAVTLVATPALAEDDDSDTSLDDIPHVTMVGTAQAEVAPDIATITIGVTTEEPSAAGAADAIASRTQAVIAAAKAKGVTPADMATQAVTLTQTFDDLHDVQGRYTGRKARGFAAENILAIKVRDLTQVGVLTEALIGAGANRFDGIGFAVEHPEPILAKLSGDAVKLARARAQIAAEAAGSRLGRVLQIDQPGSGRQPLPPMAIPMRMAAPPMPVESGTTTLSSSVEVTWALDAN